MQGFSGAGGLSGPAIVRRRGLSGMERFLAREFVGHGGLTKGFPALTIKACPAKARVRLGSSFLGLGPHRHSAVAPRHDPPQDEIETRELTLG